MLSGDADGYLAPCGCTSPMQGGLKRRTSALRGGGRRVLLDNGGLSGGTGRQREIKAETAAEALRIAGVDVANLNAEDVRVAEAVQRLSGGRMVSTSLRPSATAPAPPWREAGPFLVGGATRRTDLMAKGLREGVLKPLEAARRLVGEAEGRGLAPVLLFDGDRDAARALARAEPALRLVTYHATGRPPRDLEREGDCALATPGEHGKAVVQMAWQGGRFASSTILSLGPEEPDDRQAADLYRRYLRRVTNENLLDKLPRETGKPFSGSERCIACHAAAGKVWRASDHAHALRTLEKEGHDRDPDCVRCHVVGLESTTGFWSRAKTPRLADVGCESCHGAGAAHSASPWKVRLPKARSCTTSCHTLENSPGFDIKTYWPRVRHGR